MKYICLPILFSLLFPLAWILRADAGAPVRYLSEMRALQKKYGNREQATALHKQALQRHKRKQYEEAAEFWVRAAKSDPGWWKPYYNLGCVAALTGDRGTAIEYLKIATGISASAELYRYLRKDSDLKGIRGTSDFKSFLKSLPGYPPAAIVGSWSGYSCQNEERFAAKIYDPYRSRFAPTAYAFGMDADGKLSLNISAGPTCSGTVREKKGILLFSLSAESHYPEGEEIQVKVDRSSVSAYSLPRRDILCLQESGIIPNGCYCR